MKKIVIGSSIAFLSVLGLKAQSLPSLTNEVNQIKQEVQEVKSNPATVTKTVEVVKSNVTVANTTKLLSLIKTKVPVTAAQETKILGVVSKLDASKTSGTPTDMLKGLLGNVDFTKIFSSTQLAKLKALIPKKK